MGVAAHCCCCPSTVTVTAVDCAGAAAGGQSVTLAGPGGFTATQSTGGDGTTRFTVPAAGTYRATYTAPSGVAGGTTVVGPGCTATGVRLYPPVCAVVTVTDCTGTAYGARNAAVRIGATTQATNASGDTSWSLAPGTYTVTASKHGYNDNTGTLVVPNPPTAQTLRINLSPDSAHVCCPAASDSIAPKQWYLTDANGTWPINACVGTTAGSVTKQVSNRITITCPGNPSNGFQDYQKSVQVGGKAGAVAYHYVMSYRLNPDGSVDFPLDCSAGVSVNEIDCAGTPGDPYFANDQGIVTMKTAFLIGTCNVDTVHLTGTAEWRPGPTPPADAPLFSGTIVITNV